MKIIIALGNPGEKYKTSRHNAGWLALDILAGADSWQENKKFKALVKKDGDKLYLKPLTFMNESGYSAYQALRYYNLLSRNFLGKNKKDQDLKDSLLLIHDDLDIPLGNFKLSENSRSAGHRGVQSVINHLKTKDFPRLRLGIKSEGMGKMPTEKFVLQKFSPEELNTLENTIEEALEELKI